MFVKSAIIIIFLFLACGPAPTPNLPFLTPPPEPTEEGAPTNTPSPTDTPSPTLLPPNTPSAPPTIQPTYTLFPTYTPRPFPTPDTAMRDMVIMLQDQLEKLLDVTPIPLPTIAPIIVLPTQIPTPTVPPTITPTPSPTSTPVPTPTIVPTSTPLYTSVGSPEQIAGIPDKMDFSDGPTVTGDELYFQGQLVDTNLTPSHVLILQTQAGHEEEEDCNTERPIMLIRPPADRGSKYTLENAKYFWEYCADGYSIPDNASIIPWVDAQHWNFNTSNQELTVRAFKNSFVTEQEYTTDPGIHIFVIFAGDSFITRKAQK